MSQISFELLPNNLRVPGAYAEINNDFAVQGLVRQPYTVLITGQMLSEGTAEPLKQVQVTRAEQAETLFGKGSMLASMVAAYKANDAFTKTICIPVSDLTAGSAATGTLAFTSSATAAGILYLYIGGVLVRVGVAKDASPETIATAVADAINAQPLSVSASASLGSVTLTAKHKGENGNAIDIRVNYFSDQELPAGVALTITAMSGGVGNPDINEVIASMADTWFNGIVLPWTDSANLTGLAIELANRFGPIAAIDGVAIAAHRGNHASLTTKGQGNNSPHISIFESNAYPANAEVRAAEISAQIFRAAQNDPARPFQTLGLTNDLPPVESDRFTLEERNLLLFDGISTCFVDGGGKVRIERAISTYTENEFGGPDPSYLDLNTLFTLSNLRFTWRARILQKFPRFKLGKDGTRGDNVMTPKLMKAELVALASQWADLGLIESVTQFKTDLQVSIDPIDPNRLNMILPPDLVNQLRITAARIDFRL